MLRAVSRFDKLTTLSRPKGMPNGTEVRVNTPLPQILGRAIMFGSFLARKPRPVSGELHMRLDCFRRWSRARNATDFAGADS